MSQSGISTMTSDGADEGYMWLGATSPFNSLRLQAQLLASVLERQLQLKMKLLHPGAPHSRGILRRIRTSEAPLIWHYGGFDPWLFPFLLRRRMILVYHSITPARFFWLSRPRTALASVAGQLQLRLIPRWHTWVADSQFNAGELCRLGHRGVRVCPAIVAADRPTDVPKAAEPSLLYVGRISPNKNCVELLRQVAVAAAAVARPVQLTVVGSSKPGCRYGMAFRDTVRELSRHPCLRLVWREEGLPVAELAALYRQAWIYVSTSLHEGFGLPVCEAIAAGTPALYLQAGGTESVLSSRGVVPRASSSEYWQSLVMLVQSSGQRDALLRAQLEVVRQYMPPLIDTTVRRVYGSLLSGRPVC